LPSGVEDRRSIEAAIDRIPHRFGAKRIGELRARCRTAGTAFVSRVPLRFSRFGDVGDCRDSFVYRSTTARSPPALPPTAPACVDDEGEVVESNGQSTRRARRNLLNENLGTWQPSDIIEFTSRRRLPEPSTVRRSTNPCSTCRRHSIFATSGAFHARQAGGASRSIYRAGDLSRLEPPAVHVLTTLGVRGVIDFAPALELARHGSVRT